jgi:hypothetical protein
MFSLYSNDSLHLMIVGRVMKSEWESMTVDELFALREQIQEVLSAKLIAKKAALERRLLTLNPLSDVKVDTRPLSKPATDVQPAER